MVAIVASLAVHGFIAGYLWKAKFQPHYRAYDEEQATLVTLLPPPPPPPPKVEKPKPPPPRHQPPPVVHPRPPKITPTLSEIPPLPIPPAVTKPAPVAPPVIAPPPPTPPPPPKPHVITQPAWRRVPSAADMARYYPDRAQRLGIEGQAVLSCTVTATGSLMGCEVDHETPAGEGFGAAALKMSPLFAISPMTRDGEPVEGAKVLIPLRFQLPK